MIGLTTATEEDEGEEGGEEGVWFEGDDEWIEGEGEEGGGIWFDGEWTEGEEGGGGKVGGICFEGECGGEWTEGEEGGGIWIEGVWIDGGEEGGGIWFEGGDRVWFEGGGIWIEGVWPDGEGEWIDGWSDISTGLECVFSSEGVSSEHKSIISSSAIKVFKSAFFLEIIILSTSSFYLSINETTVTIP